jgi:hypothetical protein
MGMKGELGTFNIAEILQFIGSQEKSGVLQLSSKGRTATLCFDCGRIISAKDRREGMRDPFVSYLLENEVLTPQEVSKVLELKEKDNRDPFEILVSERLVDEERLEELVARYTQEIVVDIIKWEGGKYEFSGTTEGFPKESIFHPMRLEPILMEAVRRKDEVEEISRFLPSFDTRLRVAEPGIRDLPLEEDELTILQLVDGKRTIEQTLEDSDREELETLDILEKLFALGIVSIAEDVAQGHTGNKVMKSVMLVSASLGLVLIALLARVTVLAPNSQGDTSYARLAGSVSQFIEERELENLHFAIEAYRLNYEVYPNRLEDLVTRNFVNEDMIRNHYGVPYSYTYFPSRGTYLLSP